MNIIIKISTINLNKKVSIELFFKRVSLLYINRFFHILNICRIADQSNNNLVQTLKVALLLLIFCIIQLHKQHNITYVYTTMQD